MPDTEHQGQKLPWHTWPGRALHSEALGSALRKICPPSLRPKAGALRARLFPPDRSQVFSSIYRNATWGSDLETVSGPGSTLEETAVVRQELPGLLRRFGARSLLDAPCGDLYWMKECDLGDVDYIGMDVVPAMIDAISQQLAAPRRRFLVGDIVKDDLPKADVILCRDCLVHLPTPDVIAALRNFKRSGSTYLLTTTFTDRTDNDDLPAAGGWRPLNLVHRPFLLPDPVLVLNEHSRYADGAYPDKSLGLWDLSSLPL